MPRIVSSKRIAAVVTAVGAVMAITCAVAPAAQADSPISDAVAIANGGVALVRGATLLHSNDFGEYGCEDFVDAAFGKTTANGIPHDAALAFYNGLAAAGQGHTTLPAPPGALVFSQGEDGGHVDISIGNGDYESGGVQGFAPGYGDGTDNQILPSANLGAWTFVGWAYAPWSAV
ncbi:hypothetical protein OG579_19105 [Williamsia herbipolensis]|uniref:NlpC/P60 family protein n=1 Tax=Williamsia herbipolensis TaxID=1603258 RepID=A0AAU4K175_9NOCA|nr:hypothetical protein [Williamsia herbipolensis]